LNKKRKPLTWKHIPICICRRQVFIEGDQVKHWNPAIDRTDNPAYHVAVLSNKKANEL
jgi:hypothetical protein